MSPLQARCDKCMNVVVEGENVAEEPLISTWQGLTVQVKVIGMQGKKEHNIACAKCVRRAAYQCDRDPS